MFAAEPPAVVIAIASPLFTTNQRTTVALHGTHDALIPIGAMMPNPRKTIHRFDALAQTR